MSEAENLLNEIEQQEEKLGRKLMKFYDKNYKFLLLIPLILLILSLGYLGYFYSKNGDFIRKDVSLTGGTTITVFAEQEININNLKNSLSDKLQDFNIRELSDFRTGRQEAVIIESSIDSNELKQILEEVLGYELTEENSSIEFTGSGLSQSFYLQLIYAIVLAFSFMALVVLFIFAGGWKLKTILTTLTIIPILLFFMGVISITTATFVNLIILFFSLLSYLKYSVPSFAVVLSAFADIIMTLALVNLLGIKVSSAGIIAFLMLIGYSVDTDIMLTTRLLKRRDSEINKRLSNAFKTGLTMTLTSIVAISVALILTQSFSEILKQIFTILLIGLSFDILNTWITNASILKWYLEKRER